MKSVIGDKFAKINNFIAVGGVNKYAIKFLLNFY